jgi:2-polyprenyl-3-methyl-5-hydroxy-6-metoxy-1,4-benzoquinol methylase
MGQLIQYETSGTPSPCPGCGTAASSIRYRYTHGTSESFIYRCTQCSLEFLRPLVLTEMTERKMESVDDAEMFNSALLRTLHERLIIRPEIRMVKKLLGRNDFSMLDIGCGTGWISRIWADAGARVTGLEPSPQRAEIARQRGLRVLSCFVEELDTNERFDLIVIRHVVEHLEDPAKILRDLVPRLTPNGLLLVIAPNIDCIGRRIFDTNWIWVLPIHCNFFNPRSLRALLNSCSYDITRIYQTPSPLWYPLSFAHRFPRLGGWLNTTRLSMILFAPIIVLGYMIRRSDNLTVLARPRRKNP